MLRTTPFPTRLLVLSTAFTLAFVGIAAAQTDVTTCGQEVSGAAVLNADLDCTGFGGAAVTIHSGKLTLNGFTITGGEGVFCDAPCKVIGPGTVKESVGFGINGLGGALQVRDVALFDNAFSAVQCAGPCKVWGPAVMMNNGTGIRAGGKVIIRDLPIIGNTGFGIDARNSEGTARVDMHESVITGNGAGVVVDKGAKVFSSTISNNGDFGLQAGQTGCPHKTSVVIKNSTLIDNDSDPDCGVTQTCFDVSSCIVPPRVKVSTCDHSYVTDSGFPGSDWDVCALD